MSKFKPLFLVIGLVFCCISSHSQGIKKYVPSGDEKKGDEFFKLNNYKAALEEYKIIAEKDPSNEKINYRIGVCYLNTDLDKREAAKYLERIKDSSTEKEFKYLLGRAYQFVYRFDDAITMFDEFKSEGKGSSDNLKDADLQIKCCLTAKEMIKYHMNVEFENLGKFINSEYPDYYPFVPKDESFIIFNSKRPESGSLPYEDGTWGANIFFAKVKNGEFYKAKPIGRMINSPYGDEEAVGLSASGEYLLLYFDNMEGAGDIYISQSNRSKVFGAPKMLDDQINSMKGQEISASISNDGDVIYFASTRSGGFGGSDIWVCRRLPDGKWSPAQNLGEGVNTPYNEDFPNISPDGKTLYFSSMGHASMGGYDIFSAHLDEENNVFLDPKNIGYPLNTPDDDMNFRISDNGKYGYMSARRDSGFGDLDIYRVDFLDVEPEYTVLVGKVRSSDPALPVDSSNIFISVIDVTSGDEYGSYMPNPITGQFVIILPPGKFRIMTDVPGYEPYNQPVHILGKTAYKPLIDRNIILTPAPTEQTKEE